MRKFFLENPVWGKLILAVGLIFASTTIVFALFHWQILNWIDLEMTDRLFLREPISDEVVVVSIDNRSIQELGVWPWPREFHGNLIKKLEAAGAAVIGYDVTFAEKGIGDEEFFRNIASHENLVFPFEGSISLGSGQFPAFRETLLPLPEIRENHEVGHSLFIADMDGTVRRAPFLIQLGENLSPSFALKILETAEKIKIEIPEKFNQEIILDGSIYPLDNFGLARIFFFGPANTFRKYSFVDVLRGDGSLEQFRDKIVLVGSEAADLHDEYFTSSSGGRPVSGVEIHANVVESILQNKTLREESDPKNIFLIILALAAVAAFSVSYFKLRFALPLFFVYFTAYLVAAAVFFSEGTILPIFYPLLVLIFVYGFGVILRYLLIREEKRKLKKYFSLYVAKDVVNEILAHPEKVKLGGETKNLTILFSDIRGFTSVSEKMGAQSLVGLLNKYLTAMAEIVLDNRGVVDKFIGDAIMAFWGAPLPMENHAEAAVRTALLMSRELKKRNNEWKKLNYPEIKIGIGLNTGEAVVGNIGSHERFDYTVIGDNVNLASRLEGLTKFYGAGIIVSETTAAVVGGEFVLRQIDCVAVKGKMQGVKIYEVLGFAEEKEGYAKLIEKFEQGFELYLKKDWLAAKKVFEEILADNPDDGPSKVLKERLDEFITSPPADFDGVYHLKFK
ncbi:MAG: adenylate/guanylate cyclase domain-containing protein [Patescibacteria group bacterium]